jgi:gas vesicle protein
VFGRRQVRTQSEMMRDELGEGFDHLRMAAAYAAGTVAGAVAPRLESMRDRVEPTLDASKGMARAGALRSGDLARGGARRAGMIARRATGRKKKESRATKRWSTMVGGLMIAGATAGAAGALLSRRRQRRWSEYDSTDTMTGLRDEAQSMTDAARSTASSMTDSATDTASDVLGQMKTTTESGGTPPHPASATRTDDYSAQAESSFKSGTSGAGSRNSRP